MTLQEIINRVMRNTNNVYQDFFHITNLINNALNTLAGDARLQSNQAISVVSGTSSYPLPATYKSPITMFEGTIDNPVQVFSLVDIASPDHGFSIYDGQIFFKPTPSRTFTANFYFYAYPAELVNRDDPLTIDDRYGEALAAYASAMILSLPGMGETSQSIIERYFRFWEEARAKFKTDMQLKTKQQTVRKVENW
jgi:hypothetical protein